MTGKELALVLFVSGVAGGGAAVGSGIVTRQLAEPAVSSADDGQLARIETALARISTEQEETRKSVATLNERVTGLQMDVASAREEARRAPVAAADSPEDGEDRPGRAKRVAAPAPDEVRLRLLEAAKRLSADSIHLAGDGRLEGNVKLDGAITDALGKRLEGLSSGIRLRLLPEDKRWDQARTDMNLSEAQVADLKKAVADRDEALKEAMQVETSGEGSDQQITIKRMDHAKAAAAQEAYDKRIGSTLDAEQKKTWDQKGYGHAFGGPGGGHSIAVVHSVEAVGEDGAEKR